MIFAESYARLLLVVHTVLATALVASSTHLVIWMRGFPRGHYHRLAAVRRFATIAAALFVATLVAGNVIYPVYKVRVRAEYFDNAGTVVRDFRERAAERSRVRARYDDPAAVAAPESPVTTEELAARAGALPRKAAKVARWFDVKEHWVALGMALSAGCAVLLWTWNPRRDGSRAVASIAFLMALFAALAAWLGAVIGVVVTSWRAIGGL